MPVCSSFRGKLGNFCVWSLTSARTVEEFSPGRNDDMRVLVSLPDFYLPGMLVSHSCTSPYLGLSPVVNQQRDPLGASLPELRAPGSLRCSRDLPLPWSRGGSGGGGSWLFSAQLLPGRPPYCKTPPGTRWPLSMEKAFNPP